MRLEIPVCRRCCFCIPLRYGIIISGYLNLLSSLMIVALEVTITIQDLPTSQHITTSLYMYKGVTFYCQVWVSAILYSMEIIMSIILIIGAHTKRMKLLRVFYYYSITTNLAILVIFLVVRYGVYYNDWGHYIFEFSMALCVFVFQINLLLMIRSELKKREDRSQMTFVNHVSEIVITGPLAEGRNPL